MNDSKKYKFDRRPSTFDFTQMAFWKMWFSRMNIDFRVHLKLFQRSHTLTQRKLFWVHQVLENFDVWIQNPV